MEVNFRVDQEDLGRHFELNSWMKNVDARILVSPNKEVWELGVELTWVEPYLGEVMYYHHSSRDGKLMFYFPLSNVKELLKTPWTFPLT